MKKEVCTAFESITSEEYAKRYEPVRGFLIAEKIYTPEKSSGGIVLPNQIREGATHLKGAAIVLKKARTICESTWAQYCLDLVEVGDVVGFNATVPFLAPAPGNIQFTNHDTQPDRTITLHATDIVGFYFDSEEKRKEFDERVVSVNKAYIGRLDVLVAPAFYPPAKEVA